MKRSFYLAKNIKLKEQTKLVSVRPTKLRISSPLVSSTISILTANDLQQMITTGGCSIVDARHEQEFIAGHVPGSVWLNWESFCGDAPSSASNDLYQRGYWGLLSHDTEELVAKKLESFGLFHDRPIVVYANGPSSKGREGRIAWMLLYYGAKSVCLLDGGWMAWCSEVGHVETAIIEPAKGYFDVNIQKDRRVMLDQLKQRV